MQSAKNIKSTIYYIFIAVITFLMLQSALVLMHEFTHSTTAYLLGYTPKPFSIVWGNFIMMTGWDEGVPYSKLFPIGGNIDESIIGAMPLLVHTLIVSLGLLLLTRKFMLKHKNIFHIVFWFIIANMMELIAYIIMRPFATGGDTGHFNRGLEISPWFLFFIGASLIVYALHIIFTNILPRIYLLFACTNRVLQYAILTMTAFIMFIWGSGLRIILYIYPERDWSFGLVGLIAFLVALTVYNPLRSNKVHNHVYKTPPYPPNF